jgi:hypothetical protein
MDTATPATTDVAAALRMVLRGLLAALGGFGLEAAQAVVFYRRIGGIGARIERMLARFRAGRLRRVTGRAGRVGAIRKPNCTLPTRFGWLVKAGGHRAAVFGTQIEAVLREPEMAALLAASPQAVRVLRPLCRALAVGLPEFAAKSHPPATQDGEKPKRRRSPRPKPEPFRIPLPRGVLTAARRAGFGKAH